MAKTRRTWPRAIAVSAAASVLLTACGSDSSDEETSGGAGSSGAVVDVAAAQESIEPLTQAPSEFPITEPLEARPEPGTTVAFLDNGTQTGATFYGHLSDAAEVLGVELQRAQTGRAPQEINATLNTVVETSPDAVIDLAIDPALFTPQLEALQEAGAVVVPVAIVNGEDFGFDDSQTISGSAGSASSGAAMASALLAKTDGEATNIAIYRIPELAFTPLLVEGAEERIAEQCPDCEVRVVDIPITEVGSTAARTIVSDLQAHPETEGFLVATDELQNGLPAAMDVAGLDVPGIGYAPSPVNFQQIADGQQLGTLARDLQMLAWLTMDQVARGLAGQEQDYSDIVTEVGPAIAQIVTVDNVPSDPTVGYEAFDDLEEQFARLWADQ